jgi:hypothetical protein
MVVAREHDVTDEHGGKLVRMGRDNKWGPLPKVKELKDLAANISAAMERLNTARLRGFLAEALAKKGNA